MKLTAKCVSETFWIVQLNGRKVGNIQVDAKGATLQQGSRIEHFARLEDIARKYAMDFERHPTLPQEPQIEVLGYPTKTSAHNPEWDVHMHLPLFTSEADSRSKRCAGYYMVNHNEQGWRQSWCPKLITLKRNPYCGPFQSREALQDYWNKNHASYTAHPAV